YGKPARASTPTTNALLTADSPFDQLFKSATPSQQAILTGLSQQLKLSARNRGQEAWNLAKAVSSQKQQPTGRLNSKSKELTTLRREIRNQLTQAWPELTEPFHPALPQLLEKQGDQIFASIRKHPRHGRLEQLEKEVKQLQSQVLDLDRRWAKAKRLLQALETVALAANLPQVASEEIQQRYQELLKAEAGTFGSQDATIARKNSPPE
ncbi:MAG: hypothetical protein GY888_03265, partial [Planctomycetaceae bacterium]|nr:hypothetical protein [Planctomycetaceae bacterium]